MEPQAVQVKKEVQTHTITQENGPLKDLSVLTAAPSPTNGCKPVDGSSTTRDEDEEVSVKDDEHTELLQCTLNSSLKKQDNDDQQLVRTAPENMNAASALDKRLNIYPALPVEGAGLENHTGMKTEEIEEPSASATHPVDPADSAEAPSSCCEKTEASFASCQLPFASLVSEEMESTSW